ncbi:MAG: hypothetical protein NTX47_04245 [Candidatus Omnitrophica bacterium]|nr:hypothetical protein [Candidatus Omnitrophota bacterium]
MEKRKIRCLRFNIPGFTKESILISEKDIKNLQEREMSKLNEFRKRYLPSEKQAVRSADDIQRLKDTYGVDAVRKKLGIDYFSFRRMVIERRIRCRTFEIPGIAQAFTLIREEDMDFSKLYKRELASLNKFCKEHLPSESQPVADLKDIRLLIQKYGSNATCKKLGITSRATLRKFLIRKNIYYKVFRIKNLIDEFILISEADLNGVMQKSESDRALKQQQASERLKSIRAFLTSLDIRTDINGIENRLNKLLGKRSEYHLRRLERVWKPYSKMGLRLGSASFIGILEKSRGPNDFIIRFDKRLQIMHPGVRELGMVVDWGIAQVPETRREVFKNKVIPAMIAVSGEQRRVSGVGILGFFQMLVEASGVIGTKENPLPPGSLVVHEEFGPGIIEEPAHDSQKPGNNGHICVRFINRSVTFVPNSVLSPFSNQSNSGTHLGTKHTYDPDFRPFAAYDTKTGAAQHMNFDEAHQDLVRTLINMPGTAIFKAETNDILTQINPNAPPETVQVIETKLRNILPRIIPVIEKPVYFYFFKGAEKPAYLGNNPYTLLDAKGEDNKRGIVYLEAGSGGIDPETGEWRNNPSVYLTQELFTKLSSEILIGVLPEELEHAAVKTSGDHAAEKWEAQSDRLDKLISLRIGLLNHDIQENDIWRSVERASVLIDVEEYDAAERILYGLLDTNRVKLPGQLLSITNVLDRLLKEQGRHEDRIRAADKAIAIAGNVFKPGSTRYRNPSNLAIAVSNAIYYKARALEALGEHDKAVKIAISALEDLKQKNHLVELASVEFKNIWFELSASLSGFIGDKLSQSWEKDLKKDALYQAEDYLAAAIDNFARCTDTNIQSVSVYQARLAWTCFYKSRYEALNPAGKEKASMFLARARSAATEALKAYRTPEALTINGVLTEAEGAPEGRGQAIKYLEESYKLSQVPRTAIMRAKVALRAHDIEGAEYWLNELEKDTMSQTYIKGAWLCQKAAALWGNESQRDLACQLYTEGLDMLDKVSSAQNKLWFGILGELDSYYQYRFTAYVRLGQLNEAMIELPALLNTCQNIDDLAKFLTGTLVSWAEYEALVKALTGIKNGRGVEELVSALEKKLQSQPDNPAAVTGLSTLSAFGQAKKSHVFETKRKEWQTIFGPGSLKAQNRTPVTVDTMRQFLNALRATLTIQEQAEFLAECVSPKELLDKTAITSRQGSIVKVVMEEIQRIVSPELSEKVIEDLYKKIDDLEKDHRKQLDPLLKTKGLIDTIFEVRSKLKKALGLLLEKQKQTLAAHEEEVEPVVEVVEAEPAPAEVAREAEPIAEEAQVPIVEDAVQTISTSRSGALDQQLTAEELRTRRDQLETDFLGALDQVSRLRLPESNRALKDLRRTAHKLRKRAERFNTELLPEVEKLETSIRQLEMQLAQIESDVHVQALDQPAIDAIRQLGTVRELGQHLFDMYGIRGVAKATLANACIKGGVDPVIIWRIAISEGCKTQNDTAQYNQVLAQLQENRGLPGNRKAGNLLQGLTVPVVLLGRALHLPDRITAGLGGMEEIFFSWFFCTVLPNILHHWGMPPGFGLAIGVTLSMFFWSAMHWKTAYKLVHYDFSEKDRVRYGVLKEKIPTPLSRMLLFGIGAGLRIVYILAQIVAPWLALPLVMALHSYYNVKFAFDRGLPQAIANYIKIGRGILTLFVIAMVNGAVGQAATTVRERTESALKTPQTNITLVAQNKETIEVKKWVKKFGKEIKRIFIEAGDKDEQAIVFEMKKGKGDGYRLSISSRDSKLEISDAAGRNKKALAPEEKLGLLGVLKEMKQGMEAYGEKMQPMNKLLNRIIELFEEHTETTPLKQGPSVIPEAGYRDHMPILGKAILLMLGIPALASAGQDIAQVINLLPLSSLLITVSLAYLVYRYLIKTGYANRILSLLHDRSTQILAVSLTGAALATAAGFWFGLWTWQLGAAVTIGFAARYIGLQTSKAEYSASGYIMLAMLSTSLTFTAFFGLWNDSLYHWIHAYPPLIKSSIAFISGVGFSAIYDGIERLLFGSIVRSAQITPQDAFKRSGILVMARLGVAWALHVLVQAIPREYLSYKILAGSIGGFALNWFRSSGMNREKEGVSFLWMIGSGLLGTAACFVFVNWSTGLAGLFLTAASLLYFRRGHISNWFKKLELTKARYYKWKEYYRGIKYLMFTILSTHKSVELKKTYIKPSLQKPTKAAVTSI